MREVASAAKVATGLAYYYFASKEAIVHAFYQRSSEELRPLLEEVQKGKKLEARLRALIETKLRYFAPNRRFLGALMTSAADPANALSPFSAESREIREMDMAQFQRALDETGASMPDDLAPHMAKLLWIYQMGIILFWIYDRSADQERTARLLDSSLKMVVAMIKLSGFPLTRPARRAVLELMAIVEE